MGGELELLENALGLIGLKYTRLRPQQQLPYKNVENKSNPDSIPTLAFEDLAMLTYILTPAFQTSLGYSISDHS